MYRRGVRLQIPSSTAASRRAIRVISSSVYDRWISAADTGSIGKYVERNA